eukprot:5539146-Lingulodinium_polyedra.AAC.1
MARSNRPSAAAAARKSHTSHTPRERQKTGARTERASVRLANRCGGARRSQPHHCVAFCKRCAMM